MKLWTRNMAAMAFSALCLLAFSFAFCVPFAHAEDGSVIVTEKDHAEAMIRDMVEGGVLLGEDLGGKPDYTYQGEGEVGDCKAWLFDVALGRADARAKYSYAVYERGEVWMKDMFGTWASLMP